MQILQGGQNAASAAKLGSRQQTPVTYAATFTTPEADDETGEDLGGLDDLRAPLILPATQGLTCFV
jgi:hypothetical protein